MRAKSIQVECVGSTHGNLLLNYGESDDHVTRQATSDWQQDVRWLQVHRMIQHLSSTKQLVWGWSDVCRMQVTCGPFNLLVVGTVHGEAAPRFV